MIRDADYMHGERVSKQPVNEMHNGHTSPDLRIGVCGRGGQETRSNKVSYRPLSSRIFRSLTMITKRTMRRERWLTLTRDRGDAS